MAPTVAFVFPGQGSQHVGMLDALQPTAVLDDALASAEDLTGLPLRRIAHEGPGEALADTRAAQPLLYLAGLEWARRVCEAGVSPSFIAGHSLGELTALAFADVIPASEGLRLVCERARIMADVAGRVGGTMAAVLGLERDAVAAVVEGVGGVWLANDNSAAQSVISGTHEGIERAMEALAAVGARRIVPLDVAGPFHSPLMQPACDVFAEVLDAVSFSDASVPVLQNTDPAPERDAERLKARLRTQIVEPVRWRESMDRLLSEDIGTIVETGPGSVLTGIARRLGPVAAVSASADGVARVVEVAQ